MTELERLQNELDAATEERDRLRAQLAGAATRATTLQERARNLADSAKRVHAALFHRSVPEMVLRSCIGLTGATRGVYATARDGEFRVRASHGTGPYPRRAASPFVEALCRKALAEQGTVVCNGPEGLTDLPEPQEHERFRNCAAVPVVLMQNLDGVIIVADRTNGDFDQEDVEAVLTVGDQARVAVTNSRLQQELESAYLATVSMLADVVEAKDPYTRGHCETASRYARLIGRELQMDEEQRSALCYAALLHDVGKIGITDGILHKPGPLLPEERKLVEAHVRIGYDLLRSVPVLEDVADIVLHHHERYDGSGYPQGLSGEEIPMGARVVAVVDSYCAMLDKRAYKQPYTEEYARGELRDCAGTQFDPTVVDAFMRVLESPDALDADEDEFAECGPLPALLRFHHVRDPAE